MAGWISGQTPLFSLTAVAVVVLLSPCVTAVGAPRQMNCSLTRLESTADPNFTQSENRSISIIVDKEAKTITVSQGGSTQPLDHVTFSQLTMNGYTGDISLGMDTSSDSVVFQSYSPDANKTEFGVCRAQ